MALEFATEGEIPEPIRGDFILHEKSKKWVPKGYIPQAVHEEMSTRQAKQAERLKELEERAKVWDGLDPEKAKQAQADLDKLREEMAKTRTGKSTEELDAIVAERYGVQLKDKETLIDKLNKDLEGKKAEIHTRDEIINQRFIDIEVAAAAAKSKTFRHDIPRAIADAQFRARERFKVEDGTPIARGKDGGIILGRDNKALTIEEWLESTIDEWPHWHRPVGSGGGATGGGQPGKNTVSRRQFDGMSPAEQKEFMEKGGTVTDTAA